MDLAYFAKLSVPISIATAIFGSSAYITTLHNKVDAVDNKVSDFSNAIHSHSEKISEQKVKLARIDGKLDILIESFQKAKR